MRKIILILLIIGIVTTIIFLTSVFLVSLQNKNIDANIIIVENKSGIQVLSPQKNEIIFSPLKITGFVNGNGWIGF